MGTERSQRLSEQLRRRPEIPIALVVLAALLIGVLFRSRGNDADAALNLSGSTLPTTTHVVPTYTYVVNPLITTTTTTTTLPPETTIFQPTLTTFPIGGTYPTTTSATYQPTTTRYVPVTTYPRPVVTTAWVTTTAATTTLPTTTAVTTTLPTTTAVTTSTSTTTTTTSTTVPATRPTVLVIGSDKTPAENDRRAKLVTSLYAAGYNPIGIANNVLNATGGYSTTGAGASTVALTDALTKAEPDAGWGKVVWGPVPAGPPWTDWTGYNYTLAVVIVGPYPPAAAG